MLKAPRRAPTLTLTFAGLGCPCFLIVLLYIILVDSGAPCSVSKSSGRPLKSMSENLVLGLGLADAFALDVGYSGLPVYPIPNKSPA